MTLDPARTRALEAIAIGASAGAVEALTVLLPALSARTRLAVFVVVHLPRERPSLLPELFGPRCALQVREAQDKEPVDPGKVYFAPPDYHLLLDPGPQLSLSVDPPVHFSRPSIDVLFESAADVYEDRLLGLLLTGANEDGADGLRAIHQAGGLSVVQCPQDAQSGVMPASALARGPVDHVLSLKEIAALLQAISERCTR